LKRHAVYWTTVPDIVRWKQSRNPSVGLWRIIHNCSVQRSTAAYIVFVIERLTEEQSAAKLYSATVRLGVRLHTGQLFANTNCGSSTKSN
jgi:hypothetical protein